MLVIHKTPQAYLDLKHNALYIARDNVDAGLRFFTAAEETFRLLAENPLLGHSYERKKPPRLRCHPVRGFRNYLVFYETHDDILLIVRCIHGSRDINSEIGE